MAKNETRRNSPQVISDDVDSFNALVGVDGYDPSNTDYTVAKVTAAKTAMETAQQAETQAEAAWKAARDAANAKEWAFHNAVLGAKKQVVAQFGDDSDESQAIGFKKKSEWKAPQRNNKPVPSNN
jgi:hypothetical protein